MRSRPAWKDGNLPVRVRIKMSGLRGPLPKRPHSAASQPRDRYLLARLRGIVWARRRRRWWWVVVVVLLPGRFAAVLTDLPVCVGECRPFAVTGVRLFVAI